LQLISSRYRRTFHEEKLHRQRKYILVSIVGFLLFITLYGCASNQVSYVIQPNTMPPIAASEVKSFPDFHGIGKPWQLEGLMVPLPGRPSQPQKQELTGLTGITNTCSC